MNWDPQKIENGVYTDMPIEVYHANKTHLSASSIKEAFKSNAHFKYYREKPDRRQVFFDFGNAFELSLTDSSEFESKVAIYNEEDRPEPDKTFGSTKNKEWKARFYESNKGKLIIPATGNDSLDTLTLCKSSLYNHRSAVALLKNSEYQTSIFWKCPKTGLNLKTRPDFWKPATNKRTAIVTDLKTDKDSESDRHFKAIVDRNYPIQAVMQLMGLRAAKLIDESARFYWLVCSKSAPYNTEVYEFDSADIESFTDVLEFKLEELARAFANNSFLSYDPANCMGIKTVEFPYWYKRKMGLIEEFNQN